MISEKSEFSSNEERTYPVIEGGIISLELDETGELYWNKLRTFELCNIDPSAIPDEENVHLPHLSLNDREDVEFAFRVAYAGHDKYPKKEKDRFRKDGITHTMFHLFDVLRIGAEYKLDAKTLQVLLLHDVYEDTLFTPEFIEYLFGKDIADDIEGLTNIRRIEVDETGMREDEAATALKKFTALAEGRYRVVIGKLIDRLTSMRTIGNLKPGPQQSNALETLRVYVPLAEKSGHPELADELAYLSHKVLEPQLAFGSTEVMEQAKTEQLSFKENLETLLDYPVVSHDIRYDHCYKNLTAETSEVPGVFQYSVIVTSPEHMEKLKKKLDAAFMFSDSYSKTIVSNGEISFKRGLVEITMMIPDVVEEKEVCIADTLRFGFDQCERAQKTRDALSRKLENVVKIIDDYTKHQSLTASEALNAITGEIINPRFMTTFSKDGDPYVLPVGATIADFAAKINTDFVRHGVGALINKSDTISPLSTIVNPGDHIELIIPEKQELPWTFTVEDYNNAKTEFAKNIMAHDFDRCIMALVDHYQFGIPIVETPLFSSKKYTPEQVEEFAYGHYRKLVLTGYNKYNSHLDTIIDIPYSIALSRLWCERMQRWHTRYPTYEVFCSYFSIGQVSSSVVDMFDQEIKEYADSIEGQKCSVGDEVGGLEKAIQFTREEGRQIVDIKIEYLPDPTNIRRLNKARETSALITVFVEPNKKGSV